MKLYLGIGQNTSTRKKGNANLLNSNQELEFLVFGALLPPEISVATVPGGDIAP